VRVGLGVSVLAVVRLSSSARARAAPARAAAARAPPRRAAPRSTQALRALPLDPRKRGVSALSRARSARDPEFDARNAPTREWGERYLNKAVAIAFV